MATSGRAVTRPAHFGEALIAAVVRSCSLDWMLRDQIASLPAASSNELRARGFDPEQLVRWAASVGVDRDARNRLSGRVEPPSPGDVRDAPRPGTAEHAQLEAVGLDALARGEVALCVLAGGMATRMGGVVKSLVEVLPGKRFLDLRLAEHDHWGEVAGTPVPLWLMTSQATDAKLREALGARLDGATIATFEQHVSLRLTPEGALFLDEHGAPSPYATGHGDLPDALRRSGLLAKFRAHGGRYVWIANIDNLGATVDPAILGLHIAHGGPLTVELVDKAPGDRGGGPVRWNGKRIICEEFRLPVGFDPASVPVFNTNTFLVSARALDELAMDWTYVEVEKKIGARTAVQFERLLGEITVALAPEMLRVPREGVASRFLPVKDVPELERRRPEIEAVARARGML
jgi:UTP--glucose-1-phosphate uridylyltransferase